MAKNRYQHLGRKLHLNVSAINGSGDGNLCKSGDPGAVGTLAVVCLTDEDANGEASVDTMGVWLLDVNPAADMAVGDKVYWDNAAGELNDDNTGVEFGKVLGAVPLAGAPHETKVRVSS